MTVSPSIPATLEIRRSRLLALLATVAVAAGGITWAVAASAGSTASSSPSMTPAGREYVQGITSLSRLEQAAAFGGPGAVLDALRLSEQEKRYVNGVTSMDLVEQAAAFGGPGAVLDALGLDPQDAAYVKAIESLTPAQVAAGYGR
jgi:hypothetical protein